LSIGLREDARVNSLGDSPKIDFRVAQTRVKQSASVINPEHFKMLAVNDFTGLIMAFRMAIVSIPHATCDRSARDCKN